MASLNLIVALCLLSRLVSSMLVPPKCAENEEFSMCGHCEGSCSNPMPEGSADCLPAGCYCPKFKDYVRGETGACIPHSRCPRLELDKVFAQNPRHIAFSANSDESASDETCGENERWNDCGSVCQEMCENPRGAPVRSCPRMCQSGCFCQQEFVRSWNFECIPKSECSPHPDCAKLECPEGSSCHWEPRICDDNEKNCLQAACFAPA